MKLVRTMETAYQIGSTPLPAGQWLVDPSRSRAGFVVRKLGVGSLRGRFGGVSGSLLVDTATVAAHGSVDAVSIETGNEDRDEHLRAPGFFAAEAFPRISFRSTGVEATNERRWRVHGELTIRDRTREIELLASRTNPLRLRVRGEIDRRDYGLTWSRAIEATGVVSNVVRIELELAFVLDLAAS